MEEFKEEVLSRAKRVVSEFAGVTCFSVRGRGGPSVLCVRMRQGATVGTAMTSSTVASFSSAGTLSTIWKSKHKPIL